MKENLYKRKFLNNSVILKYELLWESYVTVKYLFLSQYFKI